MKIIQYNCQSLKKNIDTIEFFLNNNSVDICVLSETFSTGDGSFRNIIDFSFVEKAKDDGYGGVAIFFHKSIEFKKIKYISDFDIVIAQTLNLSPNITICSVYFPPSLRIDEFNTEIVRLLDFLKDRNNIFLLGDFNARSRKFGDVVDKNRGKNLARVIERSNLWCLNNSSFTFRQDLLSDEGASVADLSFSNHNFAITWEVLNVTLGKSHHFPICIQSANIKCERKFFLCKKKLIKELANIEIEPDFDSIQSKIKDEIEGCLIETSDKFKPKMWWNDSLKTLFDKKCKAFKKACARRSPECFDSYLGLVREWKSVVKKAKRDSYRSRVEELNVNSNSKCSWKFVKAVRGDFKRSASKWLEENNKDYLKLLRDQVPYSQNVFEKNVNVSADQSLAFTYEEFMSILCRKSNNVAGGVDRVTYFMIKALSDVSKSKLLTAMNDSFLNNKILEEWRIIKIVPIPKRDKDLSLIENFRPISLISTFVKMINLLVKERISDFVETHNILPQNCFAYRRNKSAPMCINKLLHEIAVLKSKYYKVLLFLVDISNAYNCVKLVLLRQILSDIGLDLLYVEWIINFLCDRKLKLGEEICTVSDGLPQGSCLSPCLFNLYTKGLHSLTDNNTSILQFADDFVILSYGRSATEAKDNLQGKIQAFADACNDLNLSFNVEKTKFMYVVKGDKVVFDLSFNNQEIPQARCVKFLGRIISSSLSAKDHYELVAKNSENNGNLFKCLTTIKAGLHPKVALNIYKSLVRSKIEYSRTSAAHKNVITVNKKIASLQNSFLRRALGVTPATHTYLFYALANELPPHERSILLTVREIIKIKFNDPALYNAVRSNKEVNSSYACVFAEFENIFENINCDIKFTKIENFSVVYKSFCGRKTQCDPKNLVSEYSSKLHSHLGEGYSAFATDASIGEQVAGCSVFHIDKNESFKFKINKRVFLLTG